MIVNLFSPTIKSSAAIVYVKDVYSDSVPCSGEAVFSVICSPFLCTVVESTLSPETLSFANTFIVVVSPCVRTGFPLYVGLSVSIVTVNTVLGLSLIKLIFPALSIAAKQIYTLLPFLKFVNFIGASQAGSFPSCFVIVDVFHPAFNFPVESTGV